MTAFPLTLVKELRARTGAPLMLLREALAACDNDLARAETYVEEHRKGPKTGQALAGQIVTGTHQGRIGAMVEVRCGTDFVARTEEFQALCRELVLQVIGGSGEGPLAEQPDVRDGSRTVGEVIAVVARKVGEEITVPRYVRWTL